MYPMNNIVILSSISEMKGGKNAESTSETEIKTKKSLTATQPSQGGRQGGRRRGDGFKRGNYAGDGCFFR